MNCKYMRSEKNWTPNDYELSFPYDKIPSNIPVEDTPNLNNRLKKIMPLSKTIHLELYTGNKELNNTLTIVAELSLTINNTVKRVDII